MWVVGSGSGSGVCVRVRARVNVFCVGCARRHDMCAFHFYVGDLEGRGRASQEVRLGLGQQG